MWNAIFLENLECANKLCGGTKQGTEKSRYQYQPKGACSYET